MLLPQGQHARMQGDGGSTPKNKSPRFQDWAKADLLRQDTEVDMGVQGSSSPDWLILGNRNVPKGAISLGFIRPSSSARPPSLTHLPAPHHGSHTVCPGVREPGFKTSVSPPPHL